MTLDTIIKQRGLIAFLIISSLVAFSCVPYNKVRYFTDMNNLMEPVPNPREQKQILPFDNLYIKILSIDEQTNRLFDANQGNGGYQYTVTFPVDKDGNIDFPFVGLINVAGLTITQANSRIQKALSEYVPKTSVIVRFVENTVTVVGQVERQGVFTFEKDKLNIYEAIALGGGITRYGDRKNVILIRQTGDKLVHNRINLSDSKIANKEYFYILPNDVIVVEPMKAISWSYNNVTFTSILTALTSLIALYVVFFPNRSAQ